jgi:hypothetical protein
VVLVGNINKMKNKMKNKTQLKAQIVIGLGYG